MIKRKVIQSLSFSIFVFAELFFPVNYVFTAENCKVHKRSRKKKTLLFTSGISFQSFFYVFFSFTWMKILECTIPCYTFFSLLNTVF